MARVRETYAVGVVLLITAYFVLPGARPVLEASIGLAAVGAIEYGVRYFEPQRRGAWRCIGLSIALLATGDTIYAAMARLGEVDYPALPDVFYIAGYVPLTVGLFWLGRPSSPYYDQTTFIDAVSLTLAGSLIVWITLVRPALEEQQLPLPARVAAVAGWVGYVGVVAAAVRMAVSWRRNASVTLLGLAVLSFLVAEVFYGSALVEGTWAAGGPVDLGYFAFTVLCGAAALTPTMRDVASPAHARHVLGPWRLTAIAIGLLVGPTVLLVEASLGVVTAGIAIAIVSALVSLLVLMRLTMTSQAYQRRAARERAVRQVSEAMVCATTPDDVVAGVRSALRGVVPEPQPVEVRMVRPAPHASRRDLDGSAEVTVPLAGSDAALAFQVPSAEAGELFETMAALSYQAALALQRIELLEASHAEDRERYFRTLVLTSTDVTLISRNGRVEYATPSAVDMFGREVVGERFEDLVHPAAEPVHPPPPVVGESAAAGEGWPDTLLEGVEGTVVRPDGSEVTVLVHRRDLTEDPTVRGVVTTLRDITQERALRRDLAYRAGHDELTGLANARAWGESLSEESDRRRAPGEGIGVLFIDLDDFKQINDRYGHHAGDEVLAEVARRIRSCLRAGDLPARVGGDEFAVLLRELSTMDDAREVARRLAEELAEPMVIDGESIRCAASIGLSYTEGQERLRSLVRQADTALYAAKEQGKGRWMEYDPRRWRPPGPARDRADADRMDTDPADTDPADTDRVDTDPADTDRVDARG